MTLEQHLQRLNLYCSAFIRQPIHITSNKILPQLVRELAPKMAVTDGKRIFLPEIPKRFDVYKRMCIEKILEIKQGYFSLPENERPNFDEYEHKNVASIIFQLLENESYHQKARELYPRMYKDVKKSSHLVDNFFDVAKLLPRRKKVKLQKAVYRYSTLVQKNKASLRTSLQYTKRIYECFEFPEKTEAEELPEWLKKLMKMFNFGGGSKLSALQSLMAGGGMVRDQLLDDYKSEFGDSEDLEETLDEAIEETSDFEMNKPNLIKYQMQEKSEEKGKGGEGYKNVQEQTRLTLKQVEREDPKAYRSCVLRYSNQIQLLKKSFERLKKREIEKLRRQASGSEIDLDAAIEFMRAVRVGEDTSDKVYSSTHKNKRDVFVGFLLDVSGSTDKGALNRIKEATTILTEAIEYIGDKYLIYGFGQSEIYEVRSFSDQGKQNSKHKLWGLVSGGGTPQAEATEDMVTFFDKIQAKTKILFTICDGQPNNTIYTRVALRQAKSKGIHTYSITVDSHADDYLKGMFGDSAYCICTDVAQLPQKAGRFYERIAF